MYGKQWDKLPSSTGAGHNLTILGRNWIHRQGILMSVTRLKKWCRLVFGRGCTCLFVKGWKSPLPVETYLSHRSKYAKSENSWSNINSYDIAFANHIYIPCKSTTIVLIAFCKRLFFHGTDHFSVFYLILKVFFEISWAYFVTNMSDYAFQTRMTMSDFGDNIAGSSCFHCCVVGAIYGHYRTKLPFLPHRRSAKFDCWLGSWVKWLRLTSCYKNMCIRLIKRIVYQSIGIGISELFHQICSQTRGATIWYWR